MEGIFPISVILASYLAFLSTGCSPSVNRYLLIEQSLLAGHPQQAAAIVEQTKDEYGAKGRLLYGMDRGLVLQVAGNINKVVPYWSKPKRMSSGFTQEASAQRLLPF